MFEKKGTILFGVFVFVMALLFLTTSPAYAAPITNFPVTITQPDGTVLNLFASGDEYFNWLRDAQGYTVIQDPNTGYYVYADLVDGKLVPTPFVTGRTDGASTGLAPYLNISVEERNNIRQSFIDKTIKATGGIKNAPNTGTITNLVVFIRFSDETNSWYPLSTYTGMLNDTTAGANSLRNYYQEASYNQLTINSTLLPTPGATIVSYQDSHSRNYFRPYNAATNTIGYTGGDSGSDRTLREHALLRDATNYISGLSQFPSGAAIDGDGDGYVDSITFVVSGSPDGWASLLWPHQWSLFSYPVKINGKTVSDYSLHLNSMLETGVLVHEMFHAIGAPDLYHYSYDGLSPVGGWDVMENDANPPQHMGCYMKFKYGKWISSIPVISIAQAYSLNPLTSSTGNCYKILSPNSSNEFFVVEYRSQTGTFESSLPGTGMLVYRINPQITGNADGPLDEVYIYRPGGTTTVNGNVNNANFSSTVGRIAINDSTDPSSFLSNGNPGGLKLCNIGASGATISFNICTSTIPTQVAPAGLINTTTPTYTWSKIAGATQYMYQLYQGSTLVYAKLVPSNTCGLTANCLHTPTTVLPYGAYSWKVRSMVGGIWQTYSAVRGFTITAPVAPTLIAPTGTIMDTTPTYSWSKLTGATQYQYALLKGTTPVYTMTVAASACGTTVNCVQTPTSVLSLGAYTWKVRALIAGVWKPFSAVKAFTLINGFNSQFTTDAVGWIPQNGAWTLGSGFYQSLGLAGKYVSTAYAASYPTFTYEVKLLRTGCVGCESVIFFRGAPSPINSVGDWNNAYELGISNDGYYYLGYQRNNAWTFIQDWTANPAITSGWNTVKVTMNGGFIHIFINGVQIGYGTNFTLFNTGRVGVGYFRSTTSTGDSLKIDYATLNAVAPASSPSTEGINFNELNWTSSAKPMGHNTAP